MVQSLKKKYGTFIERNINMVESKGWNWKTVKDDDASVWKNPCIESYYLLNRWKSQNKKMFLDLGCGIGRHSILFGLNNFDVYAFDISEEGINKTKIWAQSLNLDLNYDVGDMLHLPYQDNSMDAILCYNVISHSDTVGIKKIINELNRVLKSGGECYLTLCSKDTWGFKQESWPLIDSNTRLKMEEGPEYQVPHFYADYTLIKKLFNNFKIIFINHIESFSESNNKTYSSYHYHILISKP